MALRLVQFRDGQGARRVAAAQADGSARLVIDTASVYELAKDAARTGETLAQAVARHGLGESVDVAAALREGRVLAPIDHPDPAHLLLAGTGLTHLGSAEGRDKMHRAAEADAASQTDSMKMFLMGVKGGKPSDGHEGVQPEWFYKGDGDGVTAPEADLASPAFALDGSEEPEIAGIYLIGEDGAPLRLGFCLANEFSDHVTERGNYLWLAHSKIRPAALGPELLTGPLPADVRGESRIVRDGKTIWSKPFLTGEDNMSHTVANLEHHHFKYALFRRPGDVHVHFFGTATLSFSEGVKVESGDRFEIEAAPFAHPLRNALTVAAPHAAPVRAL
jgi:hypothetical protein